MESHLKSPYRRFHRKWWTWYANPMTYVRAFRWYYQRATRGWADCDVWGLDSYICDVMVPALEHLRKTKGGVPVPPDAVSAAPDNGDAADEEFKRWEVEWNKRLDEMIAGFKAAEGVINGPPDRFFSERPAAEVAAEEAEAARKDAERADGAKLWVSPWNYDREGAAAWTKEQEAIRQKGFATFTEYFYALWD